MSVYPFTCFVTPDAQGDLCSNEAKTMKLAKETDMHATRVAKLFHTLDCILELGLGIQSMCPELIDLKQPREI